MKKVIIFLLTLHLFASATFGGSGLIEIFKVPALMHHFSEHKNDSAESISLLQFLAMHYGPLSNHAKQHKEDHSKLPFNSQTVVINYLIASAGYSLTPLLKVEIIKFSYSQAILDLYAFSHVYNLLNPPKA